MPALRGESPKALAAFEQYYALGDRRSLADLATKSGLQLAQLKAWSSKYGWVGRVVERQQEEIAAARRAARKEAATLARRRLQRSQLMQDAGLTILNKADITRLDAETARKLLGLAKQLLESGMKIEREELGDSNEHIAPPKPLSDMTEAELDAYIMQLERDLD